VIVRYQEAGKDEVGAPQLRRGVDVDKRGRIGFSPVPSVLWLHSGKARCRVLGGGMYVPLYWSSRGETVYVCVLRVRG
jgi:hypothetical protein